MSDLRKPLSQRERVEALALAARCESGEILMLRERQQLARFVCRYENALQSVGYTDGFE